MRVLGAAKTAADVVLASGVVSRLAAPLTDGSVTIFVLHRVAGEGGRHEGVDPEHLRAVLARLAQLGHRFVGLDEIIGATPAERARLRKAVAFTADDGYHDQAGVLAPLLGEFGCPLTIFLTTGFIDGMVVPWWDRVGHAVWNTREPRLHVAVGAVPLDLSLTTDDERLSSLYAFLFAAKRMPDAHRTQAVDGLIAASRVEVPVEPFGPYRPLTWDAARALESDGLVRFGPHSVRHPILARLDPGSVDTEIRESWRRLQHELSNPLPVFCYPNGEPGDFGPREVDAVRDAGLAAAVRVGGPPVTATDLDDDHERYRLARTPMPQQLPVAVRKANGIEHLRARVVSRKSSADDRGPASDVP